MAQCEGVGKGGIKSVVGEIDRVEEADVDRDGSGGEDPDSQWIVRALQRALRLAPSR
jgi:hypothetical protein